MFAVTFGMGLSTGLAVVLVTTDGCQTSCGSTSDTPVLWADGKVREVDGKRVYVTTDLGDAWLHFPPHRRYRLQHHLGTAQITWSAYLSFDEHPLSQDDASFGDIAQAAGNAVIVERITDDEIVVKNDTCSEYYLMLQAEASGSSSTEQGGAGGTTNDAL